MNKKLTVTLVIVALALAVWGIRVYKVNVGVAKTYAIKTYHKNDSIPIDYANVRVKQVSEGALQKAGSYKYIPVSVTLQVHNKSTQTLSVIKLIESQLAYGLDVYQTNQGKFDASQLQHLAPNTSTQLTMVFQVKPDDKGKTAKLYFSQDLYPQLIKDNFKMGKRYGIAVQL
ncbi:hypothetical protein GCM10011391_34960 [Pullulanibacillus camelliae]|uniref:DUF4352 domain-containing protein n=1 Tax=Pullulanibacillus camelliae TaxID=1707096 RepID=A0A8J3E022_9BACL|nr:DUF4352 domain-containing protein [Pullulanibacillus camelliae]GGE53082.1 hypothetical protein GCM10011391_34960 [Pullulanibacillus camelliae]